VLVLLGVLGAVSDCAVRADDGVADRCSVVLGPSHHVGVADPVARVGQDAGTRGAGRVLHEHDARGSSKGLPVRSVQGAPEPGEPVGSGEEHDRAPAGRRQSGQRGGWAARSVRIDVAGPLVTRVGVIQRGHPKTDGEQPTTDQSGDGRPGGEQGRS